LCAASAAFDGRDQTRPSDSNAAVCNGLILQKKLDRAGKTEYNKPQWRLSLFLEIPTENLRQRLEAQGGRVLSAGTLHSKPQMNTLKRARLKRRVNAGGTAGYKDSSRRIIFPGLLFL